MPAPRAHYSIFGLSIRATAERAAAARKEANRLAWDAWNKRMLGYRAQPSPTLGDALNAGYLYLEVRCLGCDTHRPSRSTSCGGRSPRYRSGFCDMSSNLGCDAAARLIYPTRKRSPRPMSTEVLQGRHPSRSAVRKESFNSATADEFQFLKRLVSPLIQIKVRSE
jgi:hypothetical protein